ncbi:BTB/POZ domain [Arabidopsis suecica]|uniref:BTB/POZ domain n=1 Tax=Arabidopsis suecica TaxID=45249 RepID=A0A8T2G1A3_ARASU|nr:BTB/POZ domain [Arabidopsis suecica]
MATQSNQENFLGGFAKILSEQWQVDLLLKARDTEEGAAISAHKLVMAARSEVFKKMLEFDKFKASDGKIETVTLSELNKEELEALVEFIYNNRSVLSVKEKKHVQALYIAADKYEIPHLRDLCRKELISSLNSSNAFNILELSFIPFDKAMNDSAAIFIVRNLGTICNSVEFKVFAGKNPDLSVEIIKVYMTHRWNGQYVY